MNKVCEFLDSEMGPHNDEVHSPSHYQLAPGIEAIDVIQRTLTPEQFAGYCLGNALKCRLRAGEKGRLETDIAKSNWYRDKLRSINEHGA